MNAIQNIKVCKQWSTCSADHQASSLCGTFSCKLSEVMDRKHPVVEVRVESLRFADVLT